jgi:hypothetical protein
LGTVNAVLCFLADNRIQLGVRLRLREVDCPGFDGDLISCHAAAGGCAGRSCQKTCSYSSGGR